MAAAEKVDVKEDSKGIDEAMAGRVRAVLEFDKGPGASLVTCQKEDVTKRGDNYISCIVGAHVTYLEEGQEREVFYVVKQKRLNKGGCAGDLDNMVYGKEGGFFTRLLPRLNDTLSQAGSEALRVPTCLHKTWREEDSHLFLEDLRPRGFTSYDRKKGMDEPHTALVLRELARLHAASVLLQHKQSDEDLTATHSFLTWQWYNYSDTTQKTFDKILSGGLLTASMLAGKIGNQRVSQWFEEVAPKGLALIEEQLQSSPTFDVICHGDCWINNFLFRHDREGRPTEVMLLDLQFCRKSSLATDLTYFLFTSLTGDVRNTHIKSFLTTYYHTFKSVLEAGGEEVRFTLEDLEREYERKKLLGLLFGGLLMPNLVCDPSEVKEIDVSSKDATANYIDVKRQNSLSMLESNPLLEPRLVDLYADITRWLDTSS